MLGILQILQVVPSSSSSSLFSSFDDSAKLLHSHEFFRPYFAVTNLGVSRSLRRLHFPGKLFLGVSSKCLRDSTGNSYCKKDYSTGKVNVVEITQMRLQKILKKNLTSYGKFSLLG